MHRRLIQILTASPYLRFGTEWDLAMSCDKRGAAPPISAMSDQLITFRKTLGVSRAYQGTSCFGNWLNSSHHRSRTWCNTLLLPTAVLLTCWTQKVVSWHAWDPPYLSSVRAYIILRPVLKFGTFATCRLASIVYSRCGLTCRTSIYVNEVAVKQFSDMLVTSRQFIDVLRSTIVSNRCKLTLI